MEPVVMHLEGILLHCANSLLVFLLARRICPADDDTFPIIPLMAALLFALHPVNVEAVAWIAGRTDPLLALFILSSCCFWLQWLDELRWQDMAASLMLLGAALLTKETAFAGCMVIFLLASCWPSGSATLRQRLTAIGIISVPGALLASSLLFFRSGSSGLSRFISGTDLPAGRGIWDALIAFGFYIRKLCVPVPLNFALIEVNPVHGLLGLALVPILYWSLRRDRRAGILFISAALLILPALLIAVKQVAWTPVAERYLYLPSAFFSIGLFVLIKSSGRTFQKYLLPLMLLVLVGFSLISVQRTMLWKDKLVFFQDALAKSPGFGSLYYELGGILFQRGEIDKAGDAFAVADRLNKRPSMHLLIKSNLLRVQLAKGDYSGVRESFYQIFKDKKEAPADFLELLYKADNKRFTALSAKEKILMAEDLLGTLDLLNEKRYDPFWLYQSGQIALGSGSVARAADFFHRAYVAAPQDAHYKAAAKTYYLKLEAEKR
jgi:tetratricopeptide (TPR) repeat protein